MPHSAPDKNNPALNGLLCEIKDDLPQIARGLLEKAPEERILTSVAVGFQLALLMLLKEPEWLNENALALYGEATDSDDAKAQHVKAHIESHKQRDKARWN